jgi:2-succinyl-6-hydroxy-2,4-cyclohexadiene-1-carboxylate synthase
MTPVVFLHGFTGSPRSFSALSAQCALEQRVFAPSLLGHDPALDYDQLEAELASATSETPFDGELDRLANSLRENALEGARLALGLALRHPALVSRLTLIGGQPGIEDTTERERRRSTDNTWCRLLETAGVRAFADAWQDQALFATQARLPQELRERQARARLAHSARGLALSLRTVGLAEMPNYWPDLPRLAVPVDLVAGALDEKFCAIAERFRRCVPNATLNVVTDSGHNVLLERPDALLPFLRAAP